MNFDKLFEGVEDRYRSKVLVDDLENMSINEVANIILILHDSLKELIKQRGGYDDPQPTPADLSVDWPEQIDTRQV